MVSGKIINMNTDFWLNPVSGEGKKKYVMLQNVDRITQYLSNREVERLRSHSFVAACVCGGLLIVTS